uniref:Uncharacterized protein n=1 Tax=Acrobeloides nanus TaxID=290746 RepID=A0A914E5W7_9BILA
MSTTSNDQSSDSTEAFIVMYKWSRENVKQSEVIFQSQREDSIKRGQRMSSNTVVDWKNFCRDIAAEYCLNYKPKLGGPNMTTVFRRRTIFIPVQLPQANNADRFYGHGNQIVEDVAYSLAGRQRLSTHGILEFNVRFDDYGDTEVVYYHF